MTTLQQFNQPVTSLPPKPPQKLSKISLKTPEKLYILGAIAGTIGTVISQQAALTSIPILALLLIQRTNQHRLTLTQQQQQQQITAIVEHSLKSLPTQIQQLKTQIEELESFSNNSLTKTKLVLIKAKLSQLHQEHQVFKIKDLRNLFQQCNTLQQQLENVTHQTESLQVSQRKLDYKLQQLSSQSQPARQPKPSLNHSQVTEKVAIFIDEANLYHSASRLGLELPDYAEFLTCLRGQSDSSQAFFYTGVDRTNQHQKKFLLRLQNLGYQIISKEIIKRADGSCKANLDVELALDIVELSNTYDTAILASGDGDFAPAIERIQRLGKRVKVAGYRATTSQKLLELADDYLDLETLIGCH